MKSLTTKFVSFVSKDENELFCKIIFISIITFLFFLISMNKDVRLKPIKMSNTYKLSDMNNDRFGNFDKVHIPNESPIIAKMISVLKPSFNTTKLNDMAEKIHQAFLKYQIEPQLIVAIIDTESDFNHSLISSTGDLSMAQVNVEVWNKEFSRMNLDLIETEKLKNDQVYSLEVMAKILHILKKRYQKNDRRWYARYHSKNKKYKKYYLCKIDARLKLLEKSKLVSI